MYGLFAYALQPVKCTSASFMPLGRILEEYLVPFLGQGRAGQGRAGQGRLSRKCWGSKAMIGQSRAGLKK